MFDFTRNFAHRDHGQIGEVHVKANADIMLNGDKLPEQSVRYLLNFALQTLQDAYAGAKTADEAKGAWGKRLDAIVAGTIGTRTGGGGVSEEDKLRNSIAREMLRAKMAAEGKPYKLFTGKPAAEQAAIIAKVIETAKEVIDAEVDKRIAAKKRAANAVDLGEIGL